MTTYRATYSLPPNDPKALAAEFVIHDLNRVLAFDGRNSELVTVQAEIDRVLEPAVIALWGVSVRAVD
jgi:hypothetical protein